MKRILVLIAAILLVPVNTAFAHAGLVSANPAANSEVNVMPTEIALTFSEDLLTIGGKEVNSISLNLMDGPEVMLTDVKVDGAVLSATVPTGEYESGIYEVFYKIVSADGHKLIDSYSFSLNGPTLYTAPNPVAEKGDGVLPLPIVGAIVIVVILGGFFALRARNRKR
ncbi:CopC domain containing protein [Candidatus Nanopelagicaceae bacterium]